MSRLGIHVINAGIGESIVISLPSGGWGVVDCYAPSPADPESNPTLEFLRRHGVKTLDFLCLTHPHEDHYRGMDQLLDHLEIDRFWRFGAFTALDLRNILLKHALLSAHTNKNLKEGADLLTILLHKIYIKKEQGGIKKVIKLSDNTLLFPPLHDENANFTITSIAPSGDRIQRYEAGLSGCMDSAGNWIKPFAHRRHNEISVALILKFGKTKVILGGDVEAAGWEDVLRTCAPHQLSASGVKVSHHGSINGYTSNLWSLFSAGKNTHAVVTPYRRFSLPDDAAIQHIREHAKVLLTTCLSATTASERSRQDVSGVYGYEIQALMKATFNNWESKTAHEPGICSLIFDDIGNCEFTYSGAAGILT